jgi:fatty-acyl-CoA synthase
VLPTPEDAIAVFARVTPNKIAVTELATKKKWTYSEFNQAVAKAASALLIREYKVGDRVAVLARNSVGHVILRYACARAGLIYVPLNWRLPSAELNEIISRCSPAIVLSDEASMHQLDNLVTFVDLLKFIAESDIAEPLSSGAMDLDRPSMMLFTSGTSGKPKGVVLSERNLLQVAINFSIWTSINSDSCFLCEAPMFHTIGMNTNIHPVFQQGGAIAISDGFQAERTLDWMTDNDLGITHYVGVPQMIENFRKVPGFKPDKLRRMKSIVTGGAPHAVDDIRCWLDDGISLGSGYGMSEAGSVFGMPVDIEVIRNKIGSVGIPGPAMNTRLVKDNGQDCIAGEAGELWLAGDSIMMGYWQDKESTAQAYSEDGWFKTGDIARCDEDGFFWIVDRKKDMFISGGENVYPAEIESMLIGYPGIQEAVIIGIPDEKWGEVGCIVYVVEGDTLNKDELIAFLKSKLAGYKIPKHFKEVDVIPRTGSGKVAKNILKDQLF